MDKCYRCNEVISMCPCDESTYTADDEISRLRAELEASETELRIVRASQAESNAEVERLRAELAECRALLRRCLPIIESDAQMMADLSRFAPLDPVAQATHDATEYDSERLVREIPAALAKDDAARKGEGTQ